MRVLTEKEKRTIRTAAVLLAGYLVLFYGLAGWKKIEARRTEYQQLVADAQALKVDLQKYETKVLRLEKLRKAFQIDLQKLSKSSLVGDVSAAIQKAAAGSGIQLGPIRESAARPSAKELSSMQLEAMGPVPAIMGLLHKLETLGYPLLVDSIHLAPENSRPGNIKVSLSIVILDFEQWKTEKRNVRT